MMKPKYRKDPKPNTVVRIPLPDGRHAYICCVSYSGFWIYDFFTIHPVIKPACFSPERWKYPLTISAFLRNMVDVSQIQIPEDKETHPLLWQPAISESDRAAGIKYLIYDQRKGHRRSTADEIKGLHRRWWLMAEEIIPWIMERASEFKVIDVPPEDRDPNPQTEVPYDPKEADDELRIIEILFPPENAGLDAKREEIEFELDAELQMADCGALNGGGSGPGDCFDIALEVDPRRLKTALRVIRKVLKHFKAPPETKILEQHPEYEDPIEHPLVAAPKTK